MKKFLVLSVCINIMSFSLGSKCFAFGGGHPHTLNQYLSSNVEDPGIDSTDSNSPHHPAQKAPSHGFSPIQGITADNRIENIFYLLDSKNLANLSSVSRQCAEESVQADRLDWKRRVRNIEVIMKKRGDFIPLPEKLTHDGGVISPVAPTQELWVEVMGNNLPGFTDKKYCPDTHRIIILKGTPVEMCPDFPVRIVALDGLGNHTGASDETFIAELNRIYRKAGRDEQFRRQTLEEYNWADTADGSAPKLEEHAQLSHDNPKFLGHFTPYSEIADKDPNDLTKPSPSGEHQPRSMKHNAPNSLGFRRSGEIELFEPMASGDITGSSWVTPANWHTSGKHFKQNVEIHFASPSHLVRVRTQK